MAAECAQRAVEIDPNDADARATLARILSGDLAPLPPEVTAEHPGRTFALADLLVRASWRRQGIARTLPDLLLADRPEERATLTVLPAAAAAQHAFRAWGWRKVARARGPSPGSPVCDVLLAALPLGPTTTR